MSRYGPNNTKSVMKRGRGRGRGRGRSQGNVNTGDSLTTASITTISTTTIVTTANTAINTSVTATATATATATLPWRPRAGRVDIGEDWYDRWAASYSRVTVFNAWLNRIIFLLGRDRAGRLFMFGIRVTALAGWRPLEEAVQQAQRFGGILGIHMIHHQPAEPDSTYTDSAANTMQYLRESFPQADAPVLHFYPSSMLGVHHFRIDVLREQDIFYITYTSMTSPMVPHIPEISNMPVLAQMFSELQGIDHAQQTLEHLRRLGEPESPD